MAQQHFSEIDAEYCLAEGGGVVRGGGRSSYASVQTAEKIPRAIELTATGSAGHGSVPLESNAVVRLAKAIAAVGAWKPPIQLNETTRTYFTRMAAISPPADAARYRAVIGADAKAASEAADYFAANDPRHASTVRTDLADDRPGWLPRQRHSVGSQSDAGCVWCLTGSSGLRTGPQGGERSGHQGGVRHP
jgi:hypothetical protein